MELNFLYWLQSIRFETLDKIMVFIFSTIVGDKGQFWVYLGIILLLFKKTRKWGIGLLLSYLLSYFLCDGILKDLIARPRPCAVDESVVLLVKRSTSYSCPSVHAAIAFASAYSIFIHNKKFGIVALIFALLVALSRLYFFVHYPSDVLFGAIIGILIAIITNKIINKL